MNEQLSLSDWLAQKPLPEEIKFNDDGSCYIPIEFIKPKLDYLSPNWSTSNFIHTFYTTPDGVFWCSASIELSIDYKIDIRSEEGKKYIPPTFQSRTRTLSGSATFNVQKYYPNTNWGQTALSLCIVAAAKELGEFFGKSLNKEMLTIPTEKFAGLEKKDKVSTTLKNLVKQHDQNSKK